jgi:hypothetical protein
MELPLILIYVSICLPVFKIFKIPTTYIAQAVAVAHQT